MYKLYQYVCGLNIKQLPNKIVHSFNNTIESINRHHHSSNISIYQPEKMFSSEKSIHIRRIIACISLICKKAPMIITKLADMKCNNSNETFFELLNNYLSMIGHTNEYEHYETIIEATSELLVTLFNEYELLCHIKK